jgi:hypothetical protein
MILFTGCVSGQRQADLGILQEGKPDIADLLEEAADYIEKEQEHTAGAGNDE